MAVGLHSFAAKQKNTVMNCAKLIMTLEDVLSVADFEEILFNGLNGDQIEKLTVEEVSLHKHFDDTVTLEAWISVEPKEDNRWIWVQMRKNEETMRIEEEWYTKDNYGQEPWPSLQECLDYYAQQPGIKRSKAGLPMVPVETLLKGREYLESEAKLPVVVGCTADESVRILDLTEAPNILMAGATKQGKTMAIHVLLQSLLRSGQNLQIVLVDPKGIEYNDVFTEENVEMLSKPGETLTRLNELCNEMERRLTSPQGDSPYIVLVIDEYADLTMVPYGTPSMQRIAKEIYERIIRLAQQGRRARIHLVLATQRLSPDVIDSNIKSNFPTRMAFRVSSTKESKTIIGRTGAEELVGCGDMLLMRGGSVERVQGAYVE